MNTDILSLNNLYVNGATLTLREQNLSLKCCQSLEQKLYQDQDLFKEVLWVSVCQRASKLPAVKVGGLTKSSAVRPELNQKSAALVRVPDNFDHSQCLRDCNFAAL